MKLILLTFLFFGLQAGADGHAQGISLSLKDVPMETVFKEIRKQSGFDFFYKHQLLEKIGKVSVHVERASVQKVLDECLKGKPIIYRISGNVISILPAPERSEEAFLFLTIQGRVYDGEGNPLVGASIKVMGSEIGATADGNGEFVMRNVEPDAVLEVSFVGYETKTISVKGRTALNVSLNVATRSLDETIVKGYYNTSRKLNTGSVGKVSSNVLEVQPVTNPLAALQGRLTGIVVTQNNGFPGSGFNVQIRGRQSIGNGTYPFYVIDGVPFMNMANQLSPGGQSPFNALNPSDIESIEVLKDADATSIYGSQGANGVLLITTKKGKAGKTKVAFDTYTSWGRVTKMPALLDTPQYVRMRKEAFYNDGNAPTVSTAPDLLVWDTTRYTDWTKKIIGGTARNQNYHMSISGGNTSTQFLYSSSYNRQTTVFPQSRPTQRLTNYLNVNHISPNNRLKVNGNVLHTVEYSKLPVADITRYINLPPNAPATYDSVGKLNWTDWVGIENPMAHLQRTYANESVNFIGNLVLEYKVLPFLSFKSSMGYNFLQLNEETAVPIRAQRPSSTATGKASFQTNNFRNWIAEPQLNYQRSFGDFRTSILVGASFQQRIQRQQYLGGLDYTNDDLLGDITAAGDLLATNDYRKYRYTALYANANVNYQNRAVLSASLRRDGSSRFGPSARFASFGSVGLAYIFSESRLIKEKLKLLSFGKIRTSYGTTGNDQIGDYLFFDSWSTPIGSPYAGSSGLLPSSLFNPYLQWERTRKFEIGLDVGFFKDRVSLSAGFYSNLSNNQLIGQKLPSQTGFPNIASNQDARIRNTGFELELLTLNVQTEQLRWETSFNVTLPRNRLLKYPDLENSADRYSFMVGKPLNILFGLALLGVDPSTGIYSYGDLNGNSTISLPEDISYLGRMGQKWYGGLQNTLQYKNWQLDFLFQFVQQTGLSYIQTTSTVPGNLGNQPRFVMDRWQKPGDDARIQKFSALGNGAAYQAYTYLVYSSANRDSNASFIRLKNASLYYHLQNKWTNRLKITNLKLFVQGQNLFVLTRYKGADPETQSLSSLPPLRMLAVGLQFTL